MEKRLSARIKWSHIRRLYEALGPALKASPMKTENPESGRALVLAPHIDDDVIGCGGTLAKHAEAGDEVAALYFADCTEERIGEAREAARVIGIGKLEFLGYPSKTLLRQEDAARRLKEVLDEYRPHTVYLPSLFDRHNDHLALNHILAGLHKENHYGFTVCAYEVWTALVPNLVVDVSSTFPKKAEALSKYKSQLGANDWVDAAASLNRYRAVVSGAGRYAEGFMRYSMGKYFELWQSVYSGK